MSYDYTVWSTKEDIKLMFAIIAALLLLTSQTEAKNFGPKKGESAPQFALPTLKGDRVERLNDFLEQRRGVVLIFANGTCPPFRDTLPALHQLYDEFKDKVDWRVVYINEAHPDDEPLIDNPSIESRDRNIREGFLLPQPTTPQQKTEQALMCLTKLAVRIPALVDVDNQAFEAYQPGSVRIFLINPNGKISYASPTGPTGLFLPPLRAAIATYIQAFHLSR